MNWAIFWSALSSIATFSAVLVALYQTKIAYKKKLKLSFLDNVKIAVPQEDNFIKMIGVNIINIGNKKVIIKQISIKLGDGILLFLPELTRYVPVKLPYELNVDYSVDLLFELPIFIRHVKENILTSGVDKRDKIVFRIKDSAGKEYKAKSNFTFKSFLDKFGEVSAMNS